ncbi:zf-HC2 domain-containing protein [Candidatus Dependentiae bacterium]|nr:zf-HC2 domain-containing protein [Candidatus Dependentiae bacterium]
MECKNIKFKIVDYIENNLTQIEKKQVENHLEKCLSCRNYYDSQKKMDKLLQKAFNISGDADLKISDISKFNELLKLRLAEKNNKPAAKEKFNKNIFNRFRTVFKYAAIILIVFGMIVISYKELDKQILVIKTKHKFNDSMGLQFAEKAEIQRKESVQGSDKLENNLKNKLETEKSEVVSEKQVVKKTNKIIALPSSEVKKNINIPASREIEIAYNSKADLKPADSAGMVEFDKINKISGNDQYSISESEPAKEVVSKDISMNFEVQESIQSPEYKSKSKYEKKSGIKSLKTESLKTESAEKVYDSKKRIAASRMNSEVSSSMRIDALSSDSITYFYSPASGSNNIKPVLSDTRITDSASVSVIKNKIKEFYKNRKYKETVNLFELNKDIFNDDTEILNVTAESYMKLKNEKFALKNFQRSFEIDKSQIYIKNRINQNSLKNKD